MLLRILSGAFSSRRSAEKRVAEGLALWQAGDLGGAEASLRKAIAAGTHDPAAFYGLGGILMKQERMDEAVESLRLAAESASTNPGYWAAYGQACSSGGLASEAVRAFSRTLEIDPTLYEVEAELHKVLLDGCEWSRLDSMLADLHERARKLPPEVWTRALDPWISVSLRVEPWMRREAARQYSRRVVARAAGMPSPVRKPRASAGRLRIGYFSADFHAHATGSLSVGLFEHHDRGRFETFAYSTGRDDGSNERRRLVAAFDCFRDLHGHSAPAIAQRIADDGIDILVDLKGYTRFARPEVLALRPAPVQIHYLGFPGSLQAPFLDYFVADAIVAPDDRGDEFGECVVRLPGSYQVNDDRQAIAEATPSRADCGLPAEGFVFCCFNKTFKIEAPTFASWMRILGAVPGSVLWLYRSNETAEARLREAAARAGVDPKRLVFAEFASKAEHLARHRLADLFLDTRTCNAHTTASDALWAGLPVLTCPGDAFAGRVSASLLHAIGLPDLIAPDPAAYERMAIDLARSPERHRDLKARLAANRLTQPLFRTADFAANLERAFEAMHRRAEGGLPPAPFDVPVAPAARPG